jgi:FixJ family two-component response regulator
MPPFNRRVFIVDDDPHILSSLSFLLETEGFEVVTFESALDLLAQRDVLDKGCLLIDCCMPDLNGFDLLACLRRLRVDLPVILMTGHPDERIDRRAGEGGLPLVRKPDLDHQLVRQIRHALGNG